MTEEAKGRIDRMVGRVQRRYAGHGKVFRFLWVIVSVTVALAGLAMTVLPGPAVVVLPLGLAMLAAEFAWARRLLTLAVDRGIDAKDQLDRTSARTRALGGVAVACLAAAIAAAVLLS